MIPPQDRSEKGAGLRIGQALTLYLGRDNTASWPRREKRREDVPAARPMGGHTSALSLLLAMRAVLPPQSWSGDHPAHDERASLRAGKAFVSWPAGMAMVNHWLANRNFPSGSWLFLSRACRMVREESAYNQPSAMEQPFVPHSVPWLLMADCKTSSQTRIE